jgi:hypothetical protein
MMMEEQNRYREYDFKMKCMLKFDPCYEILRSGTRSEFLGVIGALPS